MKFWAFLLLIANLGLGVTIYFSETRMAVGPRSPDFNADKMRIVPFEAKQVNGGKPSATANGAATATEPFICVEWGGIGGTDLESARGLLANLAPNDKVAERRIEEPTRYWVHIPPSGNASAMIARLKASGVKDVFLQPDNAISLGLFGSDAM